MSWIFILIYKLLLVGSLLALTITETGHFDFTHKDKILTVYSQQLKLL